LMGQALDRAYANYTTLDCVGSVVGPVCMGQAQKWRGGVGLFLAGQAAVAVLLGSWFALRLFGYNAGVRSQQSRVTGKGSERDGEETASAA